MGGGWPNKNAPERPLLLQPIEPIEQFQLMKPFLQPIKPIEPI
jgi:hypothetical protein